MSKLTEKLKEKLLDWEVRRTQTQTPRLKWSQNTSGKVTYGSKPSFTRPFNSHLHTHKHTHTSTQYNHQAHVLQWDLNTETMPLLLALSTCIRKFIAAARCPLISLHKSPALCFCCLFCNLKLKSSFSSSLPFLLLCFITHYLAASGGMCSKRPNLHLTRFCSMGQKVHHQSMTLEFSRPAKPWHFSLCCKNEANVNLISHYYQQSINQSIKYIFS